MNTHILKLYKIDPNQSQTEMDNLENSKNVLAKVQVNVKQLEEFLENGDDFVLLKSLNKFFDIPKDPKELKIEPEIET